MPALYISAKKKTFKGHNTFCINNSKAFIGYKSIRQYEAIIRLKT